MPGEAEGKVPGVYVIGMSREGQQGKFSNINKIERLVDGLERYVKGARICLRHCNVTGTPSMTATDKALMDWIRTVDPFSSSEILTIEGVIEMFKKRCNRTRDPSGKVRQIQSPLSVGCSTYLRSRTNAYKRSARRSLASVNKPLCLVVNTLEALNLSVDISVQIAIRIWEPNHLPLAEQLVTTIACSLVHQCGFNATQAGGTGPQTTELIMAHSDTMDQNLEATMADLGQRAKFVDDLRRVDAKAEELTRAAQSVGSPKSYFHGSSYEEVERLMAARKKNQEEQLEQLNRVNRELQLVNDMLAVRAGEKAPLEDEDEER
ncbi:hypothetical protein NW755_003610 [Fusarium falciforme]|uniref:Uncharacterized protein n=1 Tax=Fusarium falciforme TaxID=195108 RepID=A0A9W8RF31_9HYPO|nr:hypothetical protein NW755_003610 [Fusarium falciforme]